MTNKTTFIIGHETEKKVLVLQTENGWSLPQVDAGPQNSVNIQELQKALIERIKKNAAVGRQLLKMKSDETGQTHYVYEAFVLDFTDDLNWVQKSEIQEEVPNNVLNVWFDEYKIPELRAPWFKATYLRNVEAWILSELDKKGYILDGKLEQIKATDFSLVIYVPTNKNNLYFKATGTASIHEAATSKYFDKKYPGKSTEIVSMNEKTGWMLMKDIGGTPLRSLKERSLWERAIFEFAKLQMNEIEHTKELLNLGVPHRSLSTLKADIDHHLEGMCDTGLDEMNKAKVMGLKEELMDMCDELHALLPFESIDHGDLHSANIQLLEGENVFLDWGDSCITHPFFTTRVFWNSLYELTENDTDEEWKEIVESFRPVYLSAWEGIALKENLERALDIAEQLGCLHRALSWYLYLTPSVEDKSEYNKPSQWLQALLEVREFFVD